MADRNGWLRDAAASSIGRALAGTLAGGVLVYLGGLFMLFGMGMSFAPGSQSMIPKYFIAAVLLIGISLLTTKQISVRGRKLMLIPVAVVLVVGLFFGMYLIPTQDYNIAASYMEQGDYERAIRLFEYLEGFGDSEEKIEECTNRIDYAEALKYIDSLPQLAYQEMFKLKGFAPADAMLASPEFQAAREKHLTVGRSVRFGMYYRDNKSVYRDVKPEPIYWRIIAREGDRALLLSSYALEQRPFHETPGDITWRDCTLRQWLNGEFLSFAFTQAEQAVIESTALSNEYGEAYDTQDRIFLLSYPELFSYLPEDDQREAEATDYVAGYGGARRTYLLRRIGAPGSQAPCIDRYGALITEDVSDPSMTVRPAMWVVLDPDFF